MSNVFAGAGMKQSPAPSGNFGINIQGTRHISSSVNQIRIVRFLIHETGTYNTQHRRPYTANLSAHNGSHLLNQFYDRFSHDTSFTPAAFGGIAGSFLRPSAAPEKEIVIPNGWNERRLRFMLEAEHVSALGTKSRAIMSGYTSHKGITLSGAIDPQMDFYVNSVISLRDGLVSTPVGLQNQTSVLESSLVLSNNYFDNGYPSPGREQDHMMRPQDVYCAIDRSLIQPLNPGDTMVDFRTAVGSGTHKSRRNNNSSSVFVSNILEGYSRATRDGFSYAGSKNSEEVMSTARSYARDPVASQDFFLAAIANNRNSQVGNSFRLSDLSLLDPGYEAVTVAMVMTPVQLAGAHTAGSTAGWGGSDLETQFVTMLAQSVPSLLMDNALTEVGFKVTNRVMSGEPIYIPYRVNTFSTNMNPIPYADSFELQLKQLVLMDASQSNMYDYDLEMDVNLLGDTRIRVSFNGAPYIDYVAPSFCDALLAPVVSANAITTSNLARDFSTLIDTIGSIPATNKMSIMTPGSNNYFAGG